MSEAGKKNANTLAIIVTWLSIVGAAAGAILTQITDLGVEVPTVVLSILSILALLARRLPSVPLANPKGSSLAIGLLVAVLSLAGVAPDRSIYSGDVDDPPANQTEDVIEPEDCGAGCPVDDLEDVREEVPLVLLPAVGARLFIHGTLGVLGCSGAQQQAWKDAGASFVNCMTTAGVPYAGDFVSGLFSDKIAINLIGIGKELWDDVIRCAIAAGMPMLFPGGGAPMADSVGATMTPDNRILAALSYKDTVESIKAACDGQDECWLVVVPQ